MQSTSNPVAPTAWLVAYRRSFSNILFSKEIFVELDKRRDAQFPAINTEILAPWMAPHFEARYKIMDRLIRAHPSTQILELAAGFSSRGLDMSQNPKIKYVEFDLPDVISEKRKIINTILEAKHSPHPPNLFFEEGNALVYSDLKSALQHFDAKPITIVNEGLLRYLSMEDKKKVARNIHSILEQFGGQWITPDWSLKKDNENEVMRAYNQKVARITGINTAANRFENEEEARSFFEKMGFSVLKHSFMEVFDELVTPPLFPHAPISAKELNKDMDAYVMTLA